MAKDLSIHLKMFNDKVKLMNQTHSRDLTLSAQEARNLHADLFDLLNHCATLSKEIQKAPKDTINTVDIAMDGGNWSDS
jgi:hypothetical protein